MSNASSDLSAEGPFIWVDDTPWPVRIVPHPRSRRYRLVFDAARGELRLTLPRRASTARALKWAGDQQSWLAEQVGKAAAPVLVGPGATLPVHGIERLVDWKASTPRTVRLADTRLCVGGPAETVGRRIARWLKAEALTLMARESREIAGAAGLCVGRVGVGDPRSRWGSCTADGDLRYSWRLVMAPEHVRRATVAHEVAHLRYMDHGADFHALVAKLHVGDVAAARHWLRREGRSLHRYRFTA